MYTHITITLYVLHYLLFRQHTSKCSSLTLFFSCQICDLFSHTKKTPFLLLIKRKHRHTKKNTKSNTNPTLLSRHYSPIND